MSKAIAPADQKPDLVQTLLAGLLAKFRVSNPGLFLLIQLVLGIIVYSLTNCQELGICVNALFGKVLLVANYALVVLLSSKTASVLMAYNQGTYGTTLTTNDKPDFIQTLIAGILDKFKVKSPQVFLLVQLALSVIAFALTNCAELNICVAPIFGKVLIGVNYVLMCLISPRTSFILDQVSLVPAKEAEEAGIQSIE